MDHLLCIHIYCYLVIVFTVNKQMYKPINFLIIAKILYTTLGSSKCIKKKISERYLTLRCISKMYNLTHQATSV